MIFKLNKNIPLSKLSDEQLIVDYQETNNKSCAGELFNRYAHLVYGICLKYIKNREESKDVAMLVFEKMLIQLTSVEVKVFKKWLYTVTRNQCLTYLRDKNRKLDQSNEWLESEKISNNFVENEDFLSPINEPAEEEQVHQALAQLKPDQRKCMDLFFFKEKSYKEIVETTGYTLKQVKSFLQNGKRKLKLILESNYIDSDK